MESEYDTNAFNGVEGGCGCMSDVLGCTLNILSCK